MSESRNKLAYQVQSILAGSKLDRTLLTGKIPRKIRAIVDEEVRQIRDCGIRNELPKVKSAGCSRWNVGTLDRGFIRRVWDRTTKHTGNPTIRDAILTSLSTTTMIYPASVLIELWRAHEDQSPAQILGTVAQPTTQVCKLALYRTIMRMVVAAEEDGQHLLSAFLLDLIADTVYDRYTKTKLRSHGFYSEVPQTTAADQLALRLLLHINKNMDTKVMCRYSGWNMNYLLARLRHHDIALSDGLSTEVIADVRAAFLA